MHEGLQPPKLPAIPPSSRATLASTRIGASVSLSGEEREALQGAALPLRSIRAGTLLVREGESADRLFLIVEGWACRFQNTRDGMRQILILAMPGDTANIDILTFEHPSYGVRALSHAKVLAIARDRALALAARYPGIARTFLFSALTDNAVLSQAMLRLGRFSARQRVAHLLCELSARFNNNDESETSFQLPLTQEQIGDALGLTPVHVNRTLQKLRTEGLIVTANRAVSIPDMERLRRVGEFDPAYLHMLTSNVKRPDLSPGTLL